VVYRQFCAVANRQAAALARNQELGREGRSARGGSAMVKSLRGDAGGRSSFTTGRRPHHNGRQLASSPPRSWRADERPRRSPPSYKTIITRAASAASRMR